MKVGRSNQQKAFYNQHRDQLVRLLAGVGTTWSGRPTGLRDRWAGLKVGCTILAFVLASAFIVLLADRQTRNNFLVGMGMLFVLIPLIMAYLYWQDRDVRTKIKTFNTAWIEEQAPFAITVELAESTSKAWWRFQKRGRVRIHISGEEQAFYWTRRKYTSLPELSAAIAHGWREDQILYHENFTEADT